MPDFALVEVAGCLVQTSDGKWMVKNATEPVRTRNPKDSSPEDLKAWETKPLGTHDFGLLDDVSIRIEPMKNHKVDAKGLLIRKPGNDRVRLDTRIAATVCRTGGRGMIEKILRGLLGGLGKRGVGTKCQAEVGGSQEKKDDHR